MKKIALLILTGGMFCTSTFAQATKVNADQKDLKNTIEDKKEDKHEAGRDLAHLRMKPALKKRREVRHHRKSISKQGDHLEHLGVKHPIDKAKHQAKADKEIKQSKQ